MCGIVGMVLKTQSGGNQADVALFSDLLYMDALRGFDSTGVACFHNNGDMRILKEAVEASWFLQTDEWKGLGKDFIKNGKALIGHNRKATIGKTSGETAHPFLIEDRFAFIHNGTLRNHKALADTEVDSEALGMHLSSCEGDKEKLEGALDKVWGAYACAWFDQEKEKLYLLRNKERPLFIADFSWGIVFASEPMMLWAAAARNNTKLENVRVVEEHTLCEIDLTTVLLTVKETKLEIKKSFPIPHTHSTKGGGKATAANHKQFSEGEVSKNQYKRIKTAFFGKTLTFWMDTFNPRVMGGDDNCEEWTVRGDNADLLAFDHKFIGWIQGYKEDEMSYLGENVPLIGKIVGVEYIPEHKEVWFLMGEVKLVATSQLKELSGESEVFQNWRH